MDTVQRYGRFDRAFQADLDRAAQLGIEADLIRLHHDDRAGVQNLDREVEDHRLRHAIDSWAKAV